MWLIVSIAGPEWVDVKFKYQKDKTWNWGIWRTCNTIDGEEKVCMEAGTGDKYAICEPIISNDIIVSIAQQHAHAYIESIHGLKDA